jgi:hypothetical protein
MAKGVRSSDDKLKKAWPASNYHGLPFEPFMSILCAIQELIEYAGVYREMVIIYAQAKSQLFEPKGPIRQS